MQITPSLFLAAFALVTLAPRLALAQETVELVAARDATLYSENGARANGGGSGIFAARTQNDGYARRALVAFDVSSIPDDAVITDVTLTMYVSRANDTVDPPSLPVRIHRVTASWSEGTTDPGGQEGTGANAVAGDVTWTHRTYDTTLWATAGGSFAATASATTDVGDVGTYPTWSSSAMVANVQAWVAGTQANHGWMVIASATADGQARRFDSSESTTAARRPVLSVTFTTANPTGACCAAGGGCTLVAAPGGGCGGTYQGDGTDCSPNECPLPTGACCLADASGSCDVVTEPACQGDGGTYQGDDSACAALECPMVLTPFVDPLPIPGVATPVAGAAGAAAEYDIAAVEIEQVLHSELPPTRVWGYDDGTGGTFPGPTIEARRDEPVAVTWRNDLRGPDGSPRTSHILEVDSCLHGAAEDDARTVVHLHGGHVAAASDGYPEDAVTPGNALAYDYPNGQDAATLWYHDHALGITRLNVYMGLAGLYVLRDDVEDALALPSGDHEIPLVIQDRSFNSDGSLDYPPMWMEHFHGDTILVNGRVWPYLVVDRGKYRFRVLNGSGSRTYTLALSTGGSMQVIGTEGGLLPAPVTVDALTIAPGERVDLVVDFQLHGAGTEIVLENSAPAPYPGSPGAGVVPHVMKFVVGSALGHTADLPATLRSRASLAEEDAVRTRDFELAKVADDCSGSRWLINGKSWHEITERPALGTTEIWRFVNRSGVSHPMHMHLVMFEILDRQPFEVVDGVPTPVGSPSAPAAEEDGWKDTVQVDPGEIVRVIARFEDFTGRFPYHCHVLEHEDNEMMRQFETVTECGDGARGMPDEECDDGNTLAGDGCSATCTVEGGAADAGPGSDGGGAGGGGEAGGEAGGGGCGCGSDGGSGVAGGWLLIAAGLIRRLRRRRHHPSNGIVGR